MCDYMKKENLSKLMLMDIHGHSAKLRTLKKSRLTDGFNILKIDKDVLYILSIKISEEEELYQIFKVDSTEEKLSKLSTTLSGYNEKKLEEIVGGEKLLPCSMADCLDQILLYFADLPGKCDIVLKRVKETSNNIYVKVYPLIQKEIDSSGKWYYPYSKGNFRDILEVAIEAGEIIEPKERR